MQCRKLLALLHVLPEAIAKHRRTIAGLLTLDDLFDREGYKAVYLALGSHHSRKLGVPGEDGKEGIIPGITFLKAYNLEGKNLAKGRVGVIGGGNSAVDAARVALRQKGVESVAIFYRRTRDEMPAYREEIEAALEEGVLLKTLAAPVEVLSENGRLTGVRFISNRLSEPDSSGRRQPVPIPGSEHTVELDTLIVAISEQPEKDGLDGLDMTGNGNLRANPESYITSRKGVFAGGDVVTGPNTIINAIAAGKNAAVMINNYLTGRLLKSLTKVRLPSVYVEPVQLQDEFGETAKRVEPPVMPAQERRTTFAEVELCISEESARCEASRCLRCDLDFTQPA